MTANEPTRPTPPSQAPGESGDPQAREEAEEAVLPGTGKDTSGETDPSNGDTPRPKPGPAKPARKGE
ncbi:MULTISPECIES: hypothetical protein [unclassified Streptomyces]|uniref:hypothetical protein n=1 Tax=unclassified Streptomyces TaxID=2593676 RepID=UPI002270B251|nr:MULTISPECIES: hypothetical protein [unclassified Streptomyces]MCY0919761.1 hypothetical protein [Streptomyces sp. H27-G5]MCY0958694.1 hypothetical protein [Streptomyces sp. H27-H5]